ncbi:phenylalanine--tRNA ligase subunit alpha [Candidatus Peregrinibacteria bacterium]|nr:phenylalanine--tRNA ligase subunit alpha [Candidatus Peregrinibacteria bacterium]
MSAFGPYITKIRSAASSAELDALELEIFSRKHGVLTVAMKDMGSLPPSEKISRGQELNRWKHDLTEALAWRRKELSSLVMGELASGDKLDVTLELPPQESGHLHPIPEFIRQVEEVFGRMGFEIAEGPEVESEQFNFNDLNIPESHPARDAQDTFWLAGYESENDPSRRLLLRTHTSNVQIRYMKTRKPPMRIICPGRVYRKDSDATHSPMFHQFEGLMVGAGVSLANMKAVMMSAIRELIAPDIDFRFRTGFFPFVEPGLEMDLRWRGDENESREGRWMEVAGCGMTHPNVLRNCGIDPDKWQGFAFGFGVERMIMIKLQIPDLRSLYRGDLRFLRQF